MKVDWGEATLGSTTHQVKAYSWWLTGEADSSSTTSQVDVCSWKLTEEANA